ncbi:MAG TPA: hypothetical protein VNA69_04690 [Thermoanaerobaculia bacterium]|nr:hypothetical protein [Thermoanaerobaculia bacterium]
MKKALLILTFLCLASLPALAQVNDTYIITAAANQGGGFGTRWLTQFSVFNPHLDYDLVVSITFLPTGGAQGIEELVKVPANSLAYSDNLLWDLFGVEGGGSLLVATFVEDNPGRDTVLKRAFLVTSNTYNNSSDGTFGQTIPGVWAGLLDFDFDSISAISQGIRNDSVNGWRTNIGAVNLGRCNVTMRVFVYDADGRTILNNAPFIIPPMAHFQDRLPVQVEAGSVEFLIEDPCASSAQNYAVVFPYTSTIDVLSGDPTYQAPALLASPSELFSLAKKATNIDPTSVGKKIDSEYARGIRALAEHRGMATLTRDAKGWRITK